MLLVTRLTRPLPAPAARLSQCYAVPDLWALPWAQTMQTLGFTQNTCSPSGPGIWGC